MQPVHVLLTGAIRIGKSTALRRAVSLLGTTPGGFVTWFPDQDASYRQLLLGAVDGSDRGCVAAETKAGNPPQCHHAAFDTLGATLLREASEKPLIVMDECGRFEAGAMAFQREVLRCLEGDVPVLGVVRHLGQPSWLDSLTSHPNVEVVVVTQENRDRIPQWLVRHFAPLLAVHDVESARTYSGPESADFLPSFAQNELK
ncbi:MAG: nucleoside-triphosphatase [Oscillospiraceae bacterium]